MDPGRDTTGLALHYSRGYPSPPELIEECLCIALRNARELSEYLGYCDFVGDWPTDGRTVFLPKPGHTAEDAVLHMDELPTVGRAIPLPAGESRHVIAPVQPVEAAPARPPGKCKDADEPPVLVECSSDSEEGEPDDSSDSDSSWSMLNGVREPALPVLVSSADNARGGSMRPGAKRRARLRWKKIWLSRVPETLTQIR